jgi:Fe2+ transport system protein FeoA
MVISLTGLPEIVQRLNDVGIFEGSVIEVIGRAPFQGPILVAIDDTVFALRWAEFRSLTLEALKK